MPLWWELATLVTIMLLGHWMEMRSITQAQGALQELAKLLPDTAHAARRTGDRSTYRSPALRDGDLVLVRPGASVPADGVVREGHSSLDESMITGESRPVEKHDGDAVIAGTVNGAGSLRVEVTGTGDRTALAGIMRLVAQAQSRASRAQALADRAAFCLTIVAVASAVVTAIVWISRSAPAAFTIERVVTVLVIACPHALGLAMPLVVAISTTLGARNGLLVRDRRGLEEARRVTTVVFDKTGTLTLGEHRVVAMRTAGGVARREGAPPRRRRRARRRTPGGARDRQERRGARGCRSRRRAASRRSRGTVCRRSSMGASSPSAVRTCSRSSASCLRRRSEPSPTKRPREGRARCTSSKADTRSRRSPSPTPCAPSRARPCSGCTTSGVEVVMLTGDVRAVAESVAREIGIDTRIRRGASRGEGGEDRGAAGAGKARRDGRRRRERRAGARDRRRGLAIGAGTDVAVEAGDIVLVRSDPRDVARIIALSRATYRKMIQNLWWAAGYNIMAIPLAAGVLQSRGFVLSPAVGAVLMSLSTIIVAINAQLLRRVRI